MHDVTRRRAAWEALSELFLDTEPDPAVIARQLLGTEFNPAELDIMLRGDVAPVLGGNLLSGAGVWSGFDLTSVEARSRAGRRSPTLLSRVTCRMIRDDGARVLERLQEV